MGMQLFYARASPTQRQNFSGSPYQHLLGAPPVTQVHEKEPKCKQAWWLSCVCPKARSDVSSFLLCPTRKFILPTAKLLISCHEGQSHFFPGFPPPHFSLLWGESLSLLRAKKWGEEQNQEDAGFVSLENWRWKKRFWCTFESCEHGSLSSSPLTLICKQGGITSSSPFWLEPVLVGGIN